LSPEAQENYKILEQAYEKETVVEEVAFGSGLIGEIGSNLGRTLYCEERSIDVEYDYLRVSPDFFSLFGLQVITGREFNEYSPKQGDMIYNETFVNKYQLENPLNSFLERTEPRGNTVGIVKDFNHSSLKNKITPIGFQCSVEDANILFVKVSTNSSVQIKTALSNMEKAWYEVSPNFPFKANFFDKHYEDVYESEIKMMKVLSVASILSIFIASLGLFCISYFIINKRINEIGIRKVNGATIVEVIQLLNMDMVKWVFVAITLAIPTAYLILDKWLENFAYKTILSWWIFALAGILALGIALFTVSWQSWRVATRNPVEALRYE
jgi:putative ABC transport system permease protein